MCQIECCLYVGHAKNWAHQTKRQYTQLSKKKKKLMIPLEVLKMDLILTSVVKPEKWCNLKKQSLWKTRFVDKYKYFVAKSWFFKARIWNQNWKKWFFLLPLLSVLMPWVFTKISSNDLSLEWILYRSCVLLHPPRIGLDGLQTGQFCIVSPLIRWHKFIKREILQFLV